MACPIDSDFDREESKMAEKYWLDSEHEDFYNFLPDSDLETRLAEAQVEYCDEFEAQKGGLACLEKYREYLHKQNKAPRTVSLYSNKLREILSWFEDESPNFIADNLLNPIETCTMPLSIRPYLKQCLTAGIRHNACNAYIAFLKFLQSEWEDIYESCDKNLSSFAKLIQLRCRDFQSETYQCSYFVNQELKRKYPLPRKLDVDVDVKLIAKEFLTCQYIVDFESKLLVSMKSVLTNVDGDSTALEIRNYIFARLLLTGGSKFISLIGDLITEMKINDVLKAKEKPKGVFIVETFKSQKRNDHLQIVSKSFYLIIKKFVKYVRPLLRPDDSVTNVLVSSNGMPLHDARSGVEYIKQIFIEHCDPNPDIVEHLNARAIATAWNVRDLPVKDIETSMSPIDDECSEESEVEEEKARVGIGPPNRLFSDEQRRIIVKVMASKGKMPQVSDETIEKACDISEEFETIWTWILKKKDGDTRLAKKSITSTLRKYLARKQ